MKPLQQQGIDKYILNVYTFVKIFTMKSLSLKLDEKVFEETEEVTQELKIARNRYINDALELYNKFNQRLLIEKQVKKEIEEGRVSSLEVMRDWEDADNAFDAKFNP
jgi:hypothetical protein